MYQYSLHTIHPIKIREYTHHTPFFGFHVQGDFMWERFLTAICCDLAAKRIFAVKNRSHRKLQTYMRRVQLKTR